MSKTPPRANQPTDPRLSETLPEQVRSDPPGLVMDGAGALAKRRVIHPTEVSGRWRRIRHKVALGLLFPLLVITPWIQMDGHQAVLLDIPGRRLVLFGHIFYPQDTFYLFLILALTGFFLFFITSLFGRLWCGFACPQTIFVEEIFRPIERLFDGPARDRIKKIGQPRTTSDWLRHFAKHGVYLLVAHLFALTVVGWFVGTHRLVNDVLTFNVGTSAFWFAQGFTLFFWFDFAIFREQFCHFVCPYARLQGVLMDRHSLVLGYDQGRGEPRAKRKKNLQHTGGDCIDCKRCVAVCPMGIDIRHGIQLECVSCALCIDACDDVMEKVGSPKGLIRFDSEEVLLHGGQRKTVRLRPAIYGVILMILTVTLAIALAQRTLVDMHVMRSAQLAITLADGRIGNPLTIKLQNKDSQSHDFTLTLDPAQGELAIPGMPLTLGPGERATLQGLVVRKVAHAQEGGPIELRVESGHDGPSNTRTLKFRLPPGAHPTPASR